MAGNAFRDRHVLVTGASSGIGAALARRFALEGARIAIVARREERLRTLADEIAGAGWHGSATGRPVRDPTNGAVPNEDSHGSASLTHATPPVVIVADLSEPDGPQRVVEQARAALGHIDVLVNNAGLGYAGPAIEHTSEQIEQMLQLNVRALVRMTELVLPEMLERGRGWIMNVASTAGYQPMPYLATYAATKAFVLSWSEALWAEVRKRGVVVTAVNPGTTRTEFFDHPTWGPGRELFMKRAMSAERVADIALRALARGKPSVVCGWGNRALALAAKIMPRSWTARMIARMLKPHR